MGKSFRDTTDDGLPIFKKQQDSVTEDGLPILKKKDSGVPPTSSDGTGGGGPSQLGGGISPFSYGALTKKPDEDKNRWVKAPLPIAKAVQEDKKKDTGTVGYVFNSIVDGVAEVIGGVPDAINAITDAGDDLIDRVHGTPGLSKSIRKSGGHPRLMPGSLPRLPEGQEVVKGMQHLFGVSTSYKPPEFDVTEGVQASDIESLAVQAPRQLMDMVYGAYTAGGSFFLQSINQNATELSENPNAEKLSPTEKLSYLFVQGSVQAALEKFSLDKILKSTGLSQKVKQRIANEITEEFVKKGKKATAKEIEELAARKASSFANQVKKVGVKSATGFTAESTTEAAQKAASDGIKLIVNTEKDVFDGKDITTNFVKNVINAGAQGGVFGVGAGAGVGVMQNTKKALRNEIAKATTPEDLQKMQANIAEQVELGNITPQEAEAANITAQQYAEVAATIPETVDAEKKYALIGGIEQREELKREIAKVNEEMSAIDPAFHGDYIAQTELLNAKLAQTNDYIDGIATGKKPTYRKEGDAFIKTDSKGETPISKEHYELATAIREEDAANNKMAEEVSKQEIKAAKILGKATLPDTYQVMAEENPIGVVKDIAKQAQNLNEQFEPHSDGKEQASLQRAKETFGEDAVNEAIALYPKPSTPMQDQEGATEGVVPSTLKDEITVGEMIDKKGRYNGKDGIFYQDGQTIIFKPEGENIEYELGNVNEVKNTSIKDFGIEHQESVVKIDNDGSFNIRGEKYNNPFEERGQNSLDAIEYDKEGNVVNVRMKTDDGQRRTFRGNVAEDIAYQIHLKEINKNNETRAAFEQHINEDAAAQKEINDAGLPEATPQSTTVSNEKISREKITPKQQSTPTNEDQETTQVPDQAETTVTEPAKPDKAGSEAKKSVLERPIEEVTIEDILKELQGDEGLAFKDVSNKDIKEGDGKDIEAYNQRAERVLKTLYPNAEFKALNTTKEYEQATGRRGEAGVLIRGKEGKHKLFLNLEAIINSDIERTATHEVVHALVSDAIGAKYVDLRKKWDSLLPKLYSVKGFEIVKEHIEKYSSADRPVEGITDLLANIVHGKIKIEDVPKNLWDEFIELVNRAFEAIGVDYKITPDTFNGFASSVKEAFETGDFTNLKKFTSKSKTEKFFKEYPEVAEAASAMIDPERRKQLEEILKTKIQQELNQGKINQNQANEFYRRAGVEPPTGDTGESKKRKFENNPKAILNRVYDSENISESVKQNFRDRGLTYSPQSHEQARLMAREIIDDFGVEDSIAMAEAGRFDGDVNSMIFAEGIDRTYAAEQVATTSDEKIRLAEQWADYTIRYDEAARQKGRFISAIYDFYRKSPLGVILSERRKRDEAFQEWFDKREKPYKEVFDALQEEPEFKEILKQKVETQLKQERAVSRMKRRKKISDIFDSAKLKGDQLSASIIPPPIWNATIEVMKQATLAGESIANVIQQGVDHIKNNYAEAWDEKTFRAEWEEKLSGIDREGKIGLTTEEKKQRILDKFIKKLSGLTEEQKEEVIRKSFKKLVEAGALEYDEFKKIVANVIGLGELTAEETTKLTGFIKDMNAVQDLSDALLKDETKENLKKFNEGVRKSEESATKLAGMLYTQPKVAQRLRSIIQLNTLGVVSLIKNPFYNIFHQALVRLPKGVVMTILDQSIYGASVGLNKAFGTPIVKPDVNILLGQKGYWGKGAKGGAEAIKQVFTGLTNKDYFQKEVYNSQIKPFTAWRDLWAWGKGKKNLTGGQITDKALQATIGVPAEGVARLLNIGDKPFRFAAEAAIAETIGRQQLGLKGFELEVFMRIPKEKAKSIYKKRGLSEEEANKKAELVEKRIIAEGEEAVFQQNNIVADVINKVKQALPSGNENHPLSSFGSGAIKMVGLLNMPFVKTPANIAWEVFNLVNPEFALFQSLAYGIKAAKTNSQADFIRAKKWMAHAATGWALLGTAGYLASIGAVSGDDEDEPYKAKESKGKGSYEKPHSVNISKVLRAPLGGSIQTEDDDVNVDLSWFGAMGMIMNMQANKYENLTKEERESMTYVDDVMFRLNRGAQDGLVNSVFQGSLTAVDALRSGRHDQWLLGMLNVGMNAVEPATLAQLSRATRPAEYKITGDDLSETMMNNLKARSFGIFGNPKTKVNIWGEPMKREGSVKDVTLRMLGFSQSDTDKFARPIFEDFKRTGDASFFPPSVSPKITVDGQEKKLSSEELLQYEALIGQARKNLVAPFINNMATVKVGKKKMKYTAMDDEQKAEALKKLYGQGFNAGKKLFVKLYPEYEKD